MCRNKLRKGSGGVGTIPLSCDSLRLRCPEAVSIICQGVSGRRPSFLAIYAKLAKINTSTFWGFEPGTNFCEKFEPGTNFCGRNCYCQAIRPPTTSVSGHFFYILRAPTYQFVCYNSTLYNGIFCVAKTSPPAPTRPRPAAPTN